MEVAKQAMVIRSLWPCHRWKSVTGTNLMNLKVLSSKEGGRIYASVSYSLDLHCMMLGTLSGCLLYDHRLHNWLES